MRFYRQSDLKSRMPYIKKELERKGIEDKERQEKIINICNEQDPSGDLAKYTLWIIKQFLKGEDIKDCKEIISEYETLVKRNKIPESKRDINKLSLESLKDTVDGSSDITNTVPKDYGRHIRKIDSDDDLTLYLIDDFETAKYLWGKNTSWCITQEVYWDDYTYDGEYPDFYCIYKNGKPYTLLHCEGKQDIEMTEDTAPTDEELLEIAPILLKNKVPYVEEYNPITLKRLGISEVNALSEDYKKSFIPESDADMEKAFQAIVDKLITKEEDKEIFEQILNKLDAEYSYKLLYKGIITSNDGELFKLALKKILESNRYLGNLLFTRTITNKDGGIFKQIVKNLIKQYSGYAYDLLKNKIITRSDGELFDEVVETAIEHSYHAYELLSEKIFTKEDGEIFNDVLKKVLEDSGWASMLLSEKIITKSDGEIFNNVLEKVIGDSEKAYNLLSKKIIKKEDREIFNKVVEKAIENPKSAYSLLDKKIITVSDGEIFDKVVEKLSEYSGWASSLLENGIIKKEDGELYDKVLEKALENSYFAYNSLRDGTITRSDGELFRKAVEAATEYSDNAYWLLKGKKITKSDVPPDLWEKILSLAEKYDSDIRQKFGSMNFRRNSKMRFYKISGRRLPWTTKNCYNVKKFNRIELFNKTAKISTDDAIKSYKAYQLLINKSITKKDGELFSRTLEEALKRFDTSVDLLQRKIITSKDGEIYNQIIQKIINEDPEYAYFLIYDKTINKKDGDIYIEALKKAVEAATKNPYLAKNILKDKVIMKPDVPVDLWEKLLISAEKVYPEARQKFAYRDLRRNSSMRYNFRRKADNEENTDIRIYLTNLGKYNEGELVGEWVTLPVDDDFEAVLERIGISDRPDEDGNFYEEYFITDYEAPFEIGEYDNIYDLNRLAKKLKDFDNSEKKVFFYCKDNGYDDDKAFEIVSDGLYHLHEASSPTDLAYEFIDQLGGIGELGEDTLENYFDYERFGNDLSYDGFYKLDNDHYIELEE